MFFRCPNIQFEEGGRHFGALARRDKHHVRVTRELIDESSELRVAHLHALELGLCLGATQLELLDDV